MSNGEYKPASRDIKASVPRAGDPDDEAYSLDSEPVAPAAKEEDEAPLSRIAESWDTFWPMSRRVKIVAILWTINLALAPVAAQVMDSLTLVIALIVNSLVQAFILGTFDRLEIRRSLSGKVVVTRTWRVAFVPLPAKRIRWRDFDSVSCRVTHDIHFEDWFGCFLLLLYCAIPAFLWYWYVIRPDRIVVAFCKDHGFSDTVLFWSSDQKLSQEVARTVAEVTGMRIT